MASIADMPTLHVEFCTDRFNATQATSPTFTTSASLLNLSMITGRAHAAGASSGAETWVDYRRQRRRDSCRRSTTARRAGTREHGRQAARSKRDLPGGHASMATDSATSAAAGGLDPLEANSATQAVTVTRR